MVRSDPVHLVMVVAREVRKVEKRVPEIGTGLVEEADPTRELLDVAVFECLRARYAGSEH